MTENIRHPQELTQVLAAIAEGNPVIIAGPSLSGKTTLAKQVAMRLVGNDNFEYLYLVPSEKAVVNKPLASVVILDELQRDTLVQADEILPQIPNESALILCAPTSMDGVQTLPLMKTMASADCPNVLSILDNAVVVELK